MKIKTSDLTRAQLSWAYLFAMYGDGPDWGFNDGRFGVIYTEMCQTGLDNYGDQESFQEYCPQDLYGEAEVRRVVAAKLGEEIEVPEELQS